MTDDDVPMVLGVRATWWIMGLSLAVITGAGVGAVQGGLFTPTPTGSVTGPTFQVVTVPPDPTRPVTGPTRDAVRSWPAVVTSTGAAHLLVSSSSSSVSSLSSSSGGSRVSSSSLSSSSAASSGSGQSKRTDCPDGYLPDDNGGCVVDHGSDPAGPPPTSGQKAGGGIAKGQGQDGGHGSSSNTPDKIKDNA